MDDSCVFRLLILADSHVALSRGDVARVPVHRNGGMGLELLRRAMDDAAARGGFDAIAMMGDVLNDGTSPDAAATLQAVARQIVEAAKDVPLLVVPGNHDGDPKRLLLSLGGRIGGQEIGGYRFFVFADQYAQGDVCARSVEDQRAFLEWAGQATSPIVVLQHNPVAEVIEDKYPYMLTNRTDVMADYGRTGVTLSLSGHYHRGQSAGRVDAVTYFTAPALCEGEFGYAVASLRGSEVSVETRRLRLPAELPLVDGHVHTEFAYCGKDTSADGAVSRAHRIGLSGIRLVEHAPQLYCRREDFWIGRHVREPALWRNRTHSRMDAFRSSMSPRRDGFTKIGLEIELDADGQVTLHDEDRWVDLLVGAVHFFATDTKDLSDAELGKLFLWTCERLIAGGAKVLAHPWRVFRWSQRRTPTELYGDLADLLAATGTAAEVNFHCNWSDPAFFATCIEKGVKIAFGSDAHELREVGSFGPHLDLLYRAADSRDPAVLRACMADI